MPPRLQNDAHMAVAIISRMDGNAKGYAAELKNGRLVTGMITQETATGLTLRRADGSSETIARSQIDQLRSSGLSYMPEGIEKQINHASMADLLAYLSSVK